jgi:hypothetical protein
VLLVLVVALMKQKVQILQLRKKQVLVVVVQMK